MALTLPKGVIFDWDNTLVDSWPAIGEAIGYVRAHYGLDVWDMETMKRRCTRSARETFPEWFGEKWQDAWTDYYAHFEQVKARLGLTPLKGAKDLLEWLKAQSIPAVVVSNKSAHHLRQESAELGWNDYFLAVAGSHDAPRDKPAREHADFALNQAGLQGGPDIWFVGDSEADVACARNAGCTPVLIGSAEDAAHHGVSRHAPDCAGLLALLCASSRTKVE